MEQYSFLQELIMGTEYCKRTILTGQKSNKLSQISFNYEMKSIHAKLMRRKLSKKPSKKNPDSVVQVIKKSFSSIKKYVILHTKGTTPPPP